MKLVAMYNAVLNFMYLFHSGMFHLKKQAQPVWDAHKFYVL
jgi:hypothetical protein